MYNWTENLHIDDIIDVLKENYLLKLLEYPDLTFTGLWKQFKSNGHYELSTEIRIKGEALTLTKTTTDMQIIDDWGETFPIYFNDQTAVEKTALNLILSSDYNKDKLESFLTRITLRIKVLNNGAKPFAIYSDNLEQYYDEECEGFGDAKSATLYDDIEFVEDIMEDIIL